MFSAISMASPPSHHSAHSSYTRSPLSSPIHPTTPLNIARQAHSSPILPSNPDSNPFSFNASNGRRSSYSDHQSATCPPPTYKRKDESNVSSSSTGTLPFSRRPIKMNPLIHGRHGVGNFDSKEHSRETRRKLFLKRVREDSEDARWKARGGDSDEMLRTIWIAEERRRTERKAREGDYVATVDSLSPDEEAGLADDERDDRMVDEMAMQEDAEMEAMLGTMEEQQDTRMDEDTDTRANHESMETPYGSDDEEYGSILIDALQAIEGRKQTTSFQGQDHRGGGGDDKMDES